MKAKDVYIQYKSDLKWLNDAMKLRGAPGHLEHGGLFVNSEQPFLPDIDKNTSVEVGAEIYGNHTHCQVTPVRNKDLRLTCIQVDRQDADKIKRCVQPMGLDTMLKLSNYALEQEHILVPIIKQFVNKKITTEEAYKQFEDIKKSNPTNFYDEQDLIDNYYKQRKDKCGSVKKLITKIETKNDEIIELEEKEIIS